MQFHLDGFEPGDPEISDRSERYPVSGAQGSVPAEVDVLIVGCGPAGLTLAAQLSQFPDIKTCIVEQKPGRLLRGQADGIACRTMEMFHAFGFSERVLKEACWINETTFWKPDDNQPANIVRSGRVQDVEDGLSEFPHVVLNQARVHDFYLDVMRRSATKLEPYYARRLVGVEPAPGGGDGAAQRVTVTLERNEGPHQGQAETIKARYVVGCDGGHSLVRRQLGIERSGSDFDQPMVLALFRSRDLHEKLKRFPPRSTYRVLNPDLQGYWQFFGRVDVGESWFFHSPVPADTTQDNYDFLALLHKAAGFSFVCDFDYVGFWDLRIAVADRYQVGRAFIAGDAAHSHPPYGGYGLNNGLDDVANLGWKLAAKLQGWGDDALLQSYTAERQPIFMETGRDFIGAGIQRDRIFLDRYDPDRDRVEFEKAWRDHEGAAAPRVLTYEPHYEGSPIVFGPAGGASSARGSHSFKARAGHHLPPQPLSSGRNVFEELGPDFTLLAFDGEDQTVAAFERAARSLGVPLKIVCDTYQDGRTAYEAKLMLIRPDRYIAWTGDAAPADAAGIIAKAVGRA